MAIKSAIDSISRKITKISQLLQEQQEYNQTHFLNAISSHRDSHSSNASELNYEGPQLNYEGQGTTNSLIISHASDETPTAQQEASYTETKFVRNFCDNQQWLAEEDNCGASSHDAAEGKRNSEVQAEQSWLGSGPQRKPKKISKMGEKQNTACDSAIEGQKKANIVDSNSKKTDAKQNFSKKADLAQTCKANCRCGAGEEKLMKNESGVRRLDQEELKKIKQSSLSGLAKQTTTNRNKRKTKRGGLISNIKSSTHFQPSGENGRKKTVQEKDKSWKATIGQAYYEADGCNNQEIFGLKKSASSNSNPSGKQWIQSVDKNRKINRVNISKLQQNIRGNPVGGITIGGSNFSTKVNFETYKKPYAPTKDLGFKSSGGEGRKNGGNLQGKKTNGAIERRNKKVSNCKGTEKEMNLSNPGAQLQSPPLFVQKLDFDDKKSVMQRILETKNIFKTYALTTKKYIEASKKITVKECKLLEKEIRSPTEQAIFMMKISTAVVRFFAQFSQPTKRTLMGMIAKALYRKEKDLDPPCLSLDTLIISLLESPKELVDVIHSLPNKLYNKNILGESSVSEIFRSYDAITQQLDSELEFFLLKRSKIYEYFHQLTEYILYLKAEDLISETERKNLNENRTVFGYYSSRSKRDPQKVKSLRRRNQHCDSERKITMEDIETERILNGMGKQDKKNQPKQEKKNQPNQG